MEAGKIGLRGYLYVMLGASAATFGTACIAMVMCPDYVLIAAAIGFIFWFGMDYIIVSDTESGAIAMAVRLFLVLCFAVVSSAAVDSYAFRNEIAAYKSSTDVDSDPQVIFARNAMDSKHAEYLVERDKGGCGPICKGLYAEWGDLRGIWVEKRNNVKNNIISNSIFKDQKIAYAISEESNNLIAFWAFSLIAPLVELLPLSMKFERYFFNRKRRRKEEEEEEERRQLEKERIAREIANTPPVVVYNSTPWD